MTVYKLNGIRMKLEVFDLDGDGKIGGVEKVSSNPYSNVHFMKESTELGEVMVEQNKDELDKTGFSSSDFKGVLNSFQYTGLVAIDMMGTMKVISTRSRDVVRHVIRKSVSVEGRGREDFTKVAVGKLERDSMKGSIKNVVTGGENK